MPSIILLHSNENIHILSVFIYVQYWAQSRDASQLSDMGHTLDIVIRYRVTYDPSRISRWMQMPINATYL